MTYSSLYWEDVNEGTDLPTIYYELSLIRLVAYTRAGGLSAYDYVHFDRDYAQSVGARDAFIHGNHVAGLFSRIITDWSGPESELRSLSFQMNSQCCAGDMLEIRGRVGAKYRGPDDEYLVDIVDLTIGYDDVPNADTGTATIQMPSRVGGAVRPFRPIRNLPGPSTSPDTPAFAQSLVGSAYAGKPEPSRPLTENEILLLCEALEDWNPNYWDTNYAATNRNGGLVAPHSSMLCGPSNDGILGIGYLKPGVAVPAPIQNGLTGMPLKKALRKEFASALNPCSVPGFPEVVATNLRAEFFRPLRVGDVGRTVQKILSVSPLKRTKLGDGHFVKWIKILSNQNDEILRTTEFDGLFYRVDAAVESI